MRLLIILLFVLANLVFMPSLSASTLSDHPLVPPPTQSPRDTLFAFLDKSRQAIALVEQAQREAAQQDGFFLSQEQIAKGEEAEVLLNQAIRTLNLIDIPVAHREHIGLERALMLKEILERIPLPDRVAVPDEATINENTKKWEHWEIPGTEIDIALGVKDHYRGEYLFSPNTVQRIPEFFEAVKHLPVLDEAMRSQASFYEYYSSTPGHLLPPKWSSLLPEWSKDELYMGQTLWQWSFLFILLLLLLSGGGHLIRRHLSAIHGDDHTLIDLIVPLLISGWLWGGLYLIEHVLNITSNVFIAVSFFIKGLIYLSFSWFTYTTINWIAEKIWRQNNNGGRSIDVSLLRTLLRLIAVIATASVIYFGAQSLGVPVAPLLAGLGALGLAIGIGAQEYFKNVVGGLTLFLDHPVRVGEECKFGDIHGQIEEVGLRATRMRLLSGQLATIPNSHFSTANIINYSRQSVRTLNTSVALRYETRREQIRAIIECLNQYLEDSDWMVWHRVRFIELGDFSLKIGIRAKVMAVDYTEFLTYQEMLLLKIMEIVEAEGAEFAFPSQTLYLENVVDNNAQTVR